MVPLGQPQQAQHVPRHPRTRRDATSCSSSSRPPTSSSRTSYPAKLEKHGLGLDGLRERFPQLVICAFSGFGLDGPDAALPGYDLIAQARSGLMSVTGVDGVPQRVSTALSDVAAGTVAAFAIAAALVRQQQTGEGEIVDVALLEADLALMSPRIASFLAGDPEPKPVRRRRLCRGDLPADADRGPAPSSSRSATTTTGSGPAPRWGSTTWPSARS